MLRALLAYNKVLYDSYLLPEKGETQASIAVLELPPRAYLRSLVSLL